MTQSTPTDALPDFVSRQVTEARRFFLNLNPDREASLEVVCGGVERMRPEYVVQRTDFPYFAVELVAEGEGTLTIHGNPYPLSAGVLFAYGPGAPHAIVNDTDNAMRKYYLDFVGRQAEALMASAGLMVGCGTYQPISVGSLHELTELFEMITRNARHDGPLTRNICESLVQLLMLKIRQLRLPESRRLPQSHATYERICRHIEQHYLRLQTIGQVAEECDVTPVYLSRLFGRFADCGAYQYLLRRKMNYAAGLLMNEGLLVKQVAERLEFADAYQFSRAFKRVYGIPPKQLAATIK
jgi:AraC-like DNA-binding protein